MVFMSRVCVLVILSTICIVVTTACTRHISFHVHFSIFGKRRRSVEDLSNYKMVFNDCNTNDKDDGLSLPEFLKCFPQPGRNLSKIFEDLDRAPPKGFLSLQEFRKAELKVQETPGKTADNCHSAMLKICGSSFLLYTTVRNENEDTVCGALEGYNDCVEEKVKNCDRDDARIFARKLRHMIETSRDDGVCPNITINDADGADKHFEKLPCSMDAIMKCDMDFLDDIVTRTPPCEALNAYEECLGETVTSCEDEASESALDAAKAILEAYKSSGVCDRKCD